MSHRAGDVAGSLEDTIQPSDLPPRPKARKRRSRALTPPETSPLIEQWKAEERVARGSWLKRWATSQVAGYRLELIVGYLTLIMFGWSAILAGIPVFAFTTPEGFAPIWGATVMVFALVAAIGAIRAGEEPETASVRVFNRIELTGTIALFLLLGVYAAILILIGNDFFADAREVSVDTATATANLGRIAVGTAIVALASHPTVRMLWLIFRPGKVMTPIATLIEAIEVVHDERKTKKEQS